MTNIGEIRDELRAARLRLAEDMLDDMGYSVLDSWRPDVIDMIASNWIPRPAEFGVDWTCPAHGNECSRAGLDWDCRA